ncbi:MAG: hypothetical protein CMI29_06260 [Opitutae bacterium]|nr:hypothetical protein [Opitutae bacterium]|tara:strand:+ start:19964 stop:20923 length:960 start_codon:yes stop_codon:yes gene_type:complete
MSNNLSDLVLVGAGKMAQAYSKVLLAQKVPFTVVGRSEDRVKILQEQFPSVLAISGGVQVYLDSNRAPKAAIIAANISYMTEIAEGFIAAGTKRVLLEKPGALSEVNLKGLLELAEAHNAEVYVGYNRRFYSSVRKVKELILEDGGLTSVHFDFTEMIPKIKKAKHGDAALAKWVLSNSSHVIDTVFHLAGYPEELTAFVGGNAVKWHPSGSIFLGMGRTDQEVPFSYHANWGSAGCWKIELNTAESKYLLSPMEQLKAQKRGEMEIEQLDIDNHYDFDFKPGIYRQTKAFLENPSESALVTIEKLLEEFQILNRIAGY